MMRKAFTVDGQPVTAVGCIFYFHHSFMVVTRDNSYEAMGGKVEIKDDSPQDTAIRECKEESNGLLIPNKEDLKTYFIHNKYLTYLVPLKEKVDVEAMGDTETFMQEKRKVEYYSYRQLAEGNTYKLNKKQLLAFINVNLVYPFLKEEYKGIIAPSLFTFHTCPASQEKSCPSCGKREDKLGNPLYKPHRSGLELFTYGLLDCVVKEKELVLFNYREGQDIWNNNVIPWKIEFMSQNRGTIYEKDKEGKLKLVSMALEKFWTLGQPLSHTIDWSNVIVQEKIDGHLIKLFYKDKWRVASNSNLCIDKECFYGCNKTILSLFQDASQHLKYDKLDKNYTYVFELVHPSAPIIIPYKQAKLYGLCKRNNETLQETILQEDIGVQLPTLFTFKTQQECVDYINSLPYLHSEGLVVIDISSYYNGRSYRRLKIKSPSYAREHLIYDCKRNDSKDKELVIKKHIVTSYIREEEKILSSLHCDLMPMYKKFAAKVDDIVKFYHSHKDKERKEYFALIPSSSFACMYKAMIDVKDIRQVLKSFYSLALTML